MEPLKVKSKANLECTIRDKIVRELVLRGWYCRITHGNAYQSGFPDIFACSRRYGVRWIEVKRPTGSRFTQAQLNVFTKFASKNVGVWVLVADTEWEINKLFGPSNWYSMLNTSRGIVLEDEVKRIPKSGPEAIIQNGILAKLTKDCGCSDSAICTKHPLNNWYCLETYGSMYQSGFPDIYCCHKIYGTRWIECKNPVSYKFTSAQTDVFPCLASQGVPIHIMTADHDVELNLLFQPANWYKYMWSA